MRISDWSSDVCSSDLHGRVIACDDTDSLLARLDSKALTLVFDRDLADVPDCLMAFHAEQTGPRRVQFRYHTSESPVPQILDAVCGAGLSVVDMSTEETDLEDIFLQLPRGAHEPAGGENATRGEDRKRSA